MSTTPPCPDRAASLPARRGVRNDGIRDLDDLRARCWIDEITGCWHWRGGRDGDGRPALWLPAQGRRTSLGVALRWFVHGELPRPGSAYHPVCGTKNCANPKHRRDGTRATQMRAARIERSPLVRARMTIARRAAGKLSDADVAAIQAHPGPLRVIAEQFGITPGYACEIRRGKRRGAPVRKAASVFDWRP